MSNYKRSYYQRKKASATMKKVWANRRRSISYKKLVADRKAAGITTHTNGKPYKDMVEKAIANSRVERVITSKPIELLISISVVGDKTQKTLNVISLVPSNVA